jgi:hypothetical protein
MKLLMKPLAIWLMKLLAIRLSPKVRGKPLVISCKSRSKPLVIVIRLTNQKMLGQSQVVVRSFRVL